MAIRTTVETTYAPTPPTRTRSAYARNLSALAAAQKPPRGTAAYSRFVNRPAARRVAAAGAVIGLTPNAATALSAVLSASGLALLALVEPSWALGLAVSCLLALGYVMDSVDGQLARLAGNGSLAGEWLDHTVDLVKTCLLHLAVLVSCYRFAPLGAGRDAWLGEAVLLLPMTFLVVDLTYYFSIVTLPLLRRQAAPEGRPGPALPAAAAAPESRWRAWLLLPLDYGVVCWTFLLLARPPAFVAAYGLMVVANAALLALGCRKWWAELRALDARGV